MRWRRLTALCVAPSEACTFVSEACPCAMSDDAAEATACCAAPLS